MCVGGVMNSFILEENKFLNRDVVGYFHADFHGVDHPGNPNFLYKLKNDPHHNWSRQDLRSAVDALNRVIRNDFPEILRQVQLDPLTACVVPRAKADNTYHPDQLLFRDAIGAYAGSAPGFRDGSTFIIRHTNTQTTHLRRPIDGFENDGQMPYPGIARDTCHFSSQIRGSHILLVDDIYTRSVNIDEDMVQALFDNGARSIVFYAIGNTVRKF
jgi:hypothetical protein